MGKSDSYYLLKILGTVFLFTGFACLYESITAPRHLLFIVFAIFFFFLFYKITPYTQGHRYPEPHSYRAWFWFQMIYEAILLPARLIVLLLRSIFN